MSIIEKIKEDRRVSLMNGDKESYGFLTTLVGEAEMIGKNKGNRAPTDEEVTSVIKKFINGVEESRKYLNDPTHGKFEESVYRHYLPTQLTEIQIIDFVNSLKAEGKNKGEIMKWFKDNHAGLYDGKFVSSLI